MAFEDGTQHSLRRYLLATTSGAALVGAVPFAAHADTPIDHIYLDVGGQYSLWGGGHTFDPSPFRFGVANGWDTNADVALQSGDWYLTLSANYGRTGIAHSRVPKYIARAAKHEESHTIVDLTLGKDVGLGMLGLDGSSIVSGGIRYEHFVGHSVISYSYGYDKYVDRQFSGWGPVITWKARTPICPEWYLGWGINAAAVYGGRSDESRHTAFDQARHKNLFVPQFGANLSATWQMPDSPLSFTAGYRGEAYFNIYDSGLSDHTVNRFQHGPFVQIGWQLY